MNPGNLSCVFCEKDCHTAVGYLPLPEGAKVACCERCMRVIYALTGHLGTEVSLWALYAVSPAPPEPPVDAVVPVDIDAASAVEAVERMLRGE